MRNYLILFLLGFLFVSCEDQLGINDDVVAQKAVENSKEIFSGEVLQVSEASIDGFQLWVVEMENGDGALLNIYWQKTTSVMHQVEGLRGPFNYSLNLPLNIVAFSTVRFLAFQSRSSQEFGSWTLTKNNFGNWIYQFKLKDNQNPLTLNAATGDSL